MEDKKLFLRNFLEFGPGVPTRDAMRRYSDEEFNRQMQEDSNMRDIAKRQKALQLAGFYLKDDPSDPVGNYTPKQYFPPYSATDGLILRDKEFENKMFQMFGGFNPDLVKRKSSNNYG